MIKEKFIFRERSQKSPTYGHVTKLFLESEFQHKGINERQNANSQQNLAVSWQQPIQRIKLFKYYTGQKKKRKLDRIAIVRIGTYL